MAAGTCTILGPYNTGDTGTIATATTSEGGAVSKNVTVLMDANNNRFYLLVCTQA